MSKLANIQKAAWYSVENLTTIVFGLISVIVVARIFGPESLGKLSMIQALSATTLFLVVLGFDHLIVRDLARKPDDYGLIFTAFILQLIGWSLHFIIILAAMYIIGDGKIDFDLIIISLAVLLATYFSRATVLRLFFQAVNLPRKIAFSALISRLVALTYLAIALWFKVDYHWVVFFIPIQAFTQFVILLTQFLLLTKVTWGFFGMFDSRRAIALLYEAFPLIASSILFPLFMQADILLISTFLDEKSVGIYSSAARLITQFVFLGHIITMTFYLTLSNKYFDKDSDTDDFIKGLVIMLYLFGGGLSMTVFLFSDLIVSSLYGSKFDGAGNILAILCWNWVFVFPAALFSRLLILKSLGKYEFIKSAVVAVFSLSLNYFLIPTFGITGAAFVSVSSYFLADFLLYSFFKETRPIFKHSVEALYLIIFSPRKAFKLVLHTLSSK